MDRIAGCGNEVDIPPISPGFSKNSEAAEGTSPAAKGSSKSAKKGRVPP